MTQSFLKVKGCIEIWKLDIMGLRMEESKFAIVMMLTRFNIWKQMISTTLEYQAMIEVVT